MEIESRPQSAELRHARSVLAALTRVGDALDAVPAGEALSILEDVVPPYPPVVELPVDVAVTEQVAVDALAAAAGVASDPAEAARVAVAAESLRTPVAR